ncbi:hypothetical protein CDAR_188281 [Caerostris darwini]|uniref:Uncharacterized protein n=1 Tax=Caerostris darwini TaxID=1538125 RepID=A0AAV4T3J6_9ARAC|nr:hypothetical protein CDAR_188281 [Caerostris darwini]
MPKRKQWKLETMLTTMEDNVAAHDRERKRIAPVRSLKLVPVKMPFNGSVELSSVNRLSTLTMTILNTRNVFKLLLFTLPPVLVLSRILLIRPLQLLLPAPIAS